MWITQLTHGISEALSICLPTHCVLCSNSLQQAISLCQRCQSELPWLGQCCQCCAIPLPVDGPSNITCGACLIRPPPFHSCRVLFRYQHPICNLLTGYKFKEKFAQGKILGQLLSDRFESYYANRTPPQLLIPVPLHPRKLKQRGFNQSHELAKLIAAQCGLPIDCKAIIKSIDTPAQSELKAAQRRQNLHQAFTLARPSRLQGIKHAAIIDDVITTTTTVSTLSRLLLKGGVEQIDIWAVARVGGY